MDRGPARQLLSRWMKSCIRPGAAAGLFATLPDPRRIANPLGPAPARMISSSSVATQQPPKQPSMASLHSGAPIGYVSKIHGLDCYVAEAPRQPPNGVVVIVPASFGWKMPNNRVLADCYAKEGNFRVFLPDFMAGVVVPEDVQDSFKVVRKTSIFKNPWRKLRHLFYVLRCMLPFVCYCRPAVAAPRIQNFLTALKKDEAKDLPVGVAGFAWGGYFVIRACWDQETNRTDGGRRALDCGFVAHPSNTKFPDDIENIHLPISWAAAETCRHMSPEQARQTKQILEAKTASGKDEEIEHEFVLYAGVNYGFAQGSDKKKPLEAEAGRQAENQAVGHFTRCFAKLRS